MSFRGVVIVFDYMFRRSLCTLAEHNKASFDDAVAAIDLTVYVEHLNPGSTIPLLRTLWRTGRVARQYSLLRCAGLSGLYVVWHRQRAGAL